MARRRTPGILSVFSEFSPAEEHIWPQMNRQTRLATWRGGSRWPVPAVLLFSRNPLANLRICEVRG